MLVSGAASSMIEASTDTDPFLCWGICTLLAGVFPLIRGLKQSFSDFLVTLIPRGVLGHSSKCVFLLGLVDLWGVEDSCFLFILKILWHFLVIKDLFSNGSGIRNKLREFSRSFSLFLVRLVIFFRWSSSKGENS